MFNKNTRKFSIKNYLMNKWLKEDNLVCVPASWQKEYVKMVGSKVRMGKLINEMIDAYNELLLDFYSKHSIKELKEILKAEQVKIDPEWDKNALAERAYEEFKMERKKD